MTPQQTQSEYSLTIQRFLLIFVTFMASTLPGIASELFTFNFLEHNSNPSSVTTTGIYGALLGEGDGGLEPVTLSFGNGLTPASYKNSFAGHQTLPGDPYASISEAIANDAYITMTVAPLPGKTLHFTSMDLNLSHQASTTTAIVALYSSQDNFASPLHTAYGTSYRWSTTADISSLSPSTDPVEFRFYFVDSGQSASRYAQRGIGLAYHGDLSDDLVFYGTLEDSVPPTGRQYGMGDHYVFERDADGWSILEEEIDPAAHQIIYVSSSMGNDTNDGLSEASPKQTIAKAVKLVREGSSDWILLKRGDTFPGVNGGFGRLAQFNYVGTSRDPLHPQLIGAYGNGSRPILTFSFYQTRRPIQNLFLRDLVFSTATDLTAIEFLEIPGHAPNQGSSENVFFENIRVEKNKVTIQGDQKRLTFYRCTFVDSHNEIPETGRWGPDNMAVYSNRLSGIYAAYSTSLLISECIFDHNGWQEGYNAQTGGSPSDPQPPSMYSHNLYVGIENLDLTVRNCITSRGASMGIKLVSPGMIEGNVYIENNISSHINDGKQNDPPEEIGVGDLLILKDNVVMHASDKDAPYIGARGWGFVFKELDAPEAGLVLRNIEAHSEASQSDSALSTASDALSLTALTQDNVVYNFGMLPYTSNPAPNWDPNPNAPYSDSSRNILTFNQSVGGAASLSDFYTQIRAQGRDNWNPNYTAKKIVSYLQDGFDLSLGARSNQVVTFTGAADGLRWDNGDNWDTGDLPGTAFGDSVLLDGVTVNYASSTEVDDLILDHAAALRIYQGRLHVNNFNTYGAQEHLIEIGRTGTLSWDRYAGTAPLRIELLGGLLEVKQRIHYSSSTQLTLNIEDGEARLAGGESGNPWSDFGYGRSLNIFGSKARVGYQGNTGNGRIAIAPGGILSFTFDADGISPIREFEGAALYSAFYMDRSITGATGASTLQIDLSALSVPPEQYAYVLVDVDEISGTFSNVDIEIGQNNISNAAVQYDYANDQVILTFTVGS